jgi:two-component system, OmpR family, response regulator
MNKQGQAKIFIVEDNFMYSYILDNVLKEHGNFAITTFATGEECIQLLGNNPDIIVMDYNLGDGMNGMQTLLAIKAKKPKTPVIIISGQDDVQVVADLLHAGAHDYIEKKSQAKTIERLVESIVGTVYK